MASPAICTRFDRQLPVTALGVMIGPLVIRSGYDVRMSTGAITTGGTLGCLWSASVMLIIVASVVDVPATARLESR